MTRPILRASTAAGLLLALVAGTASAGGWATITPDEAAADTTEPKAGETIEFGFTVLQHGQTPAGWVTPSLILTEAVTGKTFTVKSVASGAEGHFVADLTYPTSGLWTMTVELTELIVESAPTTVTVRTADGTSPAFDPAITLTAIAKAKRDILDEVGAATYPRLETLEGQQVGMQSQISRLSSERDALATRLAAIETGTEDGVPLIGVVTLAVLAGALAGFAMSWLGRRQEPVIGESGVAPGLTTSPR